MKQAHVDRGPIVRRWRDFNGLYWFCPVCGEPYKHQVLAQDCSNSHFKEDQK